jgi:hypothetical protein
MDTSNLDPVSALELRQDRILSKLAELRQTLDKLTSQYQVTQPSSSTNTQAAAVPSVKTSSSAKIKSPLVCIILYFT